jgi:hypothetical protein
MYDLSTTDWLREIKEYNFGAKITVEDTLGNKLYFKLVNMEIPFANSREIQEVTLHAIYEGEEMNTETRKQTLMKKN